jgi:hypothetical protein
MVLSYAADGTVVVKAKTATLQLGPELKVNQHPILGAGEYDISSVHCEGINLTTGQVYFFRTEDLNVAFLTHLDTDLVKHDSATGSDILVVELRSDDKVENLTAILKKVEPSYLFLTGVQPTLELLTKLALPKYESATLKITRQSLPMEGTSLVMPD